MNSQSAYRSGWPWPGWQWCRRLGAVFVLAGALPGYPAHGEPPAPTRMESRPHRLATRTWLPGSWVRVGGIAADSLLNPQLMAGSAAQIVLFDFGDHRLKAFGPDGTFRWAVGRRGQGPWEFAAVMDLQIGSDGTIWVDDHDNARIDIYRPDGTGDRMIRVEHPLYRVVPLPLGHGMIGLRESGAFLERYDMDGKQTAALGIPAILKGLHWLAAEPIFRLAPGGQLAVAFHWSSDLLVLDTTGVISGTSRGPEPMAFPATLEHPFKAPNGQDVTVFGVDPKAVQGAYGMAVQGSRVLVLYSGATPDAGRIVDSYDLPSGRYLGSMLLPYRVLSIAAVGQNLAVLSTEPEPHVDILRWVPGK